MERTLDTVLSRTKETRSKGINAALLSAFFLGFAPIFGKQAINLGLAPLGVVAFRTLFATILLFLAILVFQRKYLYIFPAGLLGCLLAGWINGLGSLFYYSALGHIDAGVGHLLYSLYPLFVAFWMFLDHQNPSRLTLLRLIIAVPAVYLLIQANNGTLDLIGVSQMLIAAALYALHLPINQRVLYEIPSPTVTFYTLLAMSAVVVPTYFFSGFSDSLPQDPQFWWPVLALTLVTFLSRLTLFFGVKHLGGMQTALLGLGELIITIALSQLWLGEKLNTLQWIGGIMLGVSLILVGLEKPTPPKSGKGGWFSWLRPPISLPHSDIPWQPGE
jgi:drug/metabolite transporter (DMT)-like permease